jgi:hypothetical protein
MLEPMAYFEMALYVRAELAEINNDDQFKLQLLQLEKYYICLLVATTNLFFDHCEITEEASNRMKVILDKWKSFKSNADDYEEIIMS